MLSTFLCNGTNLFWQAPHRSGRASSSRGLCSPFPDQVAGMFAPPVEGAVDEPQAVHNQVTPARFPDLYLFCEEKSWVGNKDTTRDFRSSCLRRGFFLVRRLRLSPNLLPQSAGTASVERTRIRSQRFAGHRSASRAYRTPTGGVE